MKRYLRRFLNDRKARGEIPPLAFALIIVLIILLVIAFVPEVRDAVMEMLRIVFGNS